MDKKFDFDYVPNFGDAMLDCFSFGNHKPYYKYIYETRQKFYIMAKNSARDIWHEIYCFDNIDDARQTLNNLENSTRK